MSLSLVARQVLDFCLELAVDSAGAEGRYTPLSTGLLFGVFVCRLVRKRIAFTRKMKSQIFAAPGGTLREICL